MGYYIGHYYFGKRDLFLLVASALLGLVIYLEYPIPVFDAHELVVLTVLALFAKGLLTSVHDSTVFLAFFAALVLTLFIPFVQVLIFLFLSFIFLHVMKII